MEVGGRKEEFIIGIKNCIELSGKWVPGMSRDLHWNQLARRQ